MKSLRVAIILIFFFFSTSSIAAERLLTIVHTNDMHSHLQGFSPEIDYRPLSVNADHTLGGWARIATVIMKTKKEKNNPVLVLDAGDFTMGSLFHLLNREEAFELRLLSAMGYDAVTLGNHEFDLKPTGLARTLRSAKAKGGLPTIVFASAVFDRQKPPLTLLEDAFAEAGVKPYTILTRNGLKIGIFGIIGKDAAEVAPFAKPLTFRDPVETASKMVDILRNIEKVDIVICLSHGGIRDNPKLSEDEILASKVKGIDIIISGHSHTKLSKPIVVGNTIIVQSWEYGKQVGILDLTIASGNVAVKKYTPVPIDSGIRGDDKIQTMIDSFKQTIDTRSLSSLGLSYDKVIAETKWDLINTAEESPLGNLVTDAIRWYVNSVDSVTNDPSSRVVFAVESNGIIRDNILAGKTGRIILGDLFRTIPLGIGADDSMTYPLISFYLYGYEVKRAMEILTSVRPLKNNNYYLQISGLRVEYNPHRMIFDRVTKIEIGSEEDGYKPLNYGKSNRQLYRVASNIYNATFLKMVGRFTYSFLEIIPKDKNGAAIDKLASALVDADKSRPGIQELKQWQGLIRFVESFPDTDKNGIPDIPDKYKGRLGRIIEKPSWNPVNLLTHAEKPTLIAVAVLGVVVLLLAVVMAGIRKRKKGKKPTASRQAAEN